MKKMDWRDVGLGAGVTAAAVGVGVAFGIFGKVIWNTLRGEGTRLSFSGESTLFTGEDPIIEAAKKL